MTPQISLMVVYGASIVYLDDCCINLRFDKERYTPYSQLHGQWYCPAGTEINEIVTVILFINNAIIHYGYPTGIDIFQKDGRTVLDISSTGYTSALMTNQCADGLIADVNLTELAAKNGVLPLVLYQENTPKVNYVNYYNGTSVWESIVCYSIRATGNYPYIRGYDTVRISPPEDRGYLAITTADLISRGNVSDYSKIISSINEKDIDGTPNTFVLSNAGAVQRMIVRRREINFDREWIMDPDKGLGYMANYSMRALDSDHFSFIGYSPLDLMDSIAITDLNYVGEVDRIRITASVEKGFITTVWCYKDNYCPCR